jgi:hypothetical protein
MLISTFNKSNHIMKLAIRKLSKTFEILLLILAISLLQAVPGKTYAQNPPIIKTDTATKADDGPPKIGELVFINQMRGAHDLTYNMVDIDSDFVFKQTPDANGLILYSATDKYLTSVEIVGNGRDIKTAKWTIVFTKDKDVNTKELFRMTRFTQIIEGAEAVQWMADIAKDKIAAHPLDDYTETKEFIEGREITFDFKPKLIRASVTITFKKP